MKRVSIALVALALVVAACSADGDSADETSTSADIATTTETVWSADDLAGLVTICISDAAARAEVVPPIPHYSTASAPDQCEVDVQILRLQGCSVVAAEQVLTDWDASKSPLQCPTNP